MVNVLDGERELASRLLGQMSTGWMVDALQGALRPNRACSFPSVMQGSAPATGPNSGD